MIIARQSTAVIVTVGPVLDADGVAVTDGVVADFKASKNGGAPAALNGSATLTHRHTGHYSLSLTTTDTNTVGTLEIVIDDTVNACPMKELTVLEEAVYDALFAASALGYVANAPVNVAQFGGTNGTFSAGRPEVNTTLIEGSDATNQIRDAVVDDATRIDASALNTATVTTIPGIDAKIGTPLDQGTGANLGANLSDMNDKLGTPVDQGSGATLAGNLADTFGRADSAAISAGTIEVLIGTPSDLGSGATVAANLVDIEAQTDDIGVAGAGLTALASAANLATVSTRVLLALPNAGDGEAGGLWILGANAPAATTLTGSSSPGLTLNGGGTGNSGLTTVGASLAAGWQSVGGNNAPGVAMTGTGSGSGLSLWAGATGDDLLLVNSDAPTLGTVVRTAVGLASANLDTQLGDLPTAPENADAFLARNISGGSSTGRTVGRALKTLSNKIAFDVPGAGQFTIYDNDDTTPLIVGTYTSAAANPVSGIDPT